MLYRSKYEAYCRTIATPLKEYTEWAIKMYHEKRETDEESYYTGYLCGFHRIITLMQQQSEMYRLDWKQLGIDTDESLL